MAPTLFKNEGCANGVTMLGLLLIELTGVVMFSSALLLTQATACEG